MLEVQAAKGFNYQPSYARNGNDIWWRFDEAVFARELGLGKKYFPNMNAVRIWLAWDVFALGSDAEKEIFLDNFDEVLRVCEALRLAVMPGLFNRWHSGMPDWGGVYLDHLLPGQSSANKRFDGKWREYIVAIMSRFGKDERIFCWDTCNEPFFYNGTEQETVTTAEHEQEWLEAVYESCKAHNPLAPVSVGFLGPFPFLERLGHISDIFNCHFYCNLPGDTAKQLRKLDDCVALAEKVGKPVIMTETCWGSNDDRNRAEIIDFTLSALNKRNISWLAYLLHHSLVSDAHRREFGPVGTPGHMEFIEADGSLRQGHDVINKFFLRCQ